MEISDEILNWCEVFVSGRCGSGVGEEYGMVKMGALCVCVLSGSLSQQHAFDFMCLVTCCVSSYT